jgi:hypothetical protein
MDFRGYISPEAKWALIAFAALAFIIGIEIFLFLADHVTIGFH